MKLTRVFTMNKNYFKPHYVFLIIALIYGISFLVITPPFQVPDEQSHFLKIFYLSNGNIFPDEKDYYFPNNTEEAINYFSYLKFNAQNKVKVEDIFLFLNKPLTYNDDKVFIDISNIAIYPPVSHLAAAFVFIIGKLLNLSALALMYLGRLINLLIWSILVYFAIKIIPVHKWTLLLLALMPMTLFMAASLSADSLTIGLSFLVIAIFFRFAFDESKKEIDNKDLFIILISVFLLSLSKQGYAILLLLFFLIPVYKFKSKKIRVLAFSLIGAFTLSFLAIWNLLFKNTYVSIQNPSVSMSGQFSFILSNPLNFIHVLSNTFNIHLKSYLISFVGNFGWLDTPLPLIIVFSYLALLVIVALLDKNKVEINLKQKLISLITFLSIFITVFLFEYLTWNPVGSNVIEGVQGRYILPITPLLFLLFYNQREKIFNGKINFKLQNNIKAVVTIFLLFVLTVAVSILILRYYIG